ncbi:MAG: hypothetical protein OHK0038_18850 [Flammeovirgaceae bacterium]
MKTITISLIGIIICLKALAQTTNHGTDPNWYQTPKIAATITGSVSQTNYVKGSVANCMVVKSKTVIIFYRQNGQNKWIQSTDDGNAWTSPSTLPASISNGLSTVTADIDQNDNIYAAWKSGDFSLGFSKFNGTSWSNASTINTQTQTESDTISFSQITVDRKGRIHLMWQQGDHQNYSSGIKSTCWYARSTDGGNTFSAPVLLSEGNNSHAAFPVADFGGTSHDVLMIAWRENVNGCSSLNPSPCSSNGWNWDVKARMTQDGGATWNPVFTLEGSSASNDTDHDQWDPNIVVDKNGVIHAFYHIYHNITIPDYNAKIMYEYSMDGGKTWSTPKQLSTNNIRSHLIKTAYDYSNNAVWCVWKDEMDFGNIPNNPQADLKAVYIVNTGTPVISEQEFLCDHKNEEIALHNFKVGNDGIIRATYNISKIAGNGDAILYTQRTTLNSTTGLTNNNSLLKNIELFPNPANDYVYLNINESFKIEGIKLYNIQGLLIANYSQSVDKIYLPEKGIYVLEFISNGKKFHSKIMRQ